MQGDRSKHRHFRLFALRVAKLHGLWIRFEAVFSFSVVKARRDLVVRLILY